MVSAALRYFGLIFALGFLLGTVRTLLLAPATGATAAVLIELPVMLGASWLAARPIQPGALGRRSALHAGLDRPRRATALRPDAMAGGAPAPAMSHGPDGGGLRWLHPRAARAIRAGAGSTGC
jgi:hypothetical protein